MPEELTEGLPGLISRIIAEVQEDKLDKRIFEYTDYKNKYTVLKSAVTVEVALTSGKVAKFDVTDYFENELKKGK